MALAWLFERNCDATYLDLVLRTGAQLATFDQRLATAVERADATVFN
jgi:predicted nucleic acid-binding protein